MKNSFPISTYVAWLCALIIIGHSLIHHLSGSGAVNVISWDVYGYYVYLPALFNYGDPVYYSFLADHFAQYPISGNLYQVSEVIEGKMAPIYTIGLAIIWTPAYAVANFVAWISPAYPMDGLSAPYQWAVILTNWLFTILGIVYLRKVLLHLVNERITALVLLFILLGTNYYHYAVFENGMSHTYLFSLYAILLYYTIKWHQQPSYFATFIIGVCIALLCLARPSEVVSLLIPLLYGVYSLETLREKISLIMNNLRMVGLLIVTGVALVFIQVIYWKLTIGLWLHNGYSGHHFDFLAPHLWEGIFSYRKGWLLYTPMMLLAILGFIPLFSSERKWRLPVLSFFLINIFIVLSWHIWWYASCFGMRALIQSYAVLAIPMALFLKSTFQYRWARIISIAFGIFCLGLNHFQDWQYRHRILAMDGMTQSFYWNAWGKTSFDGDAYKYIDNDERLPDNFSGESKRLATYESGLDSMQRYKEKNFQGKNGFVQPPEMEFGPKVSYTIPAKMENKFQGKWISVKAHVLSASSKFDEYQAARLVFSFERNGKAIKWRGVRFQRYRPEREWIDVNYHLQLPDTIKPNDVVKAYLWNRSPDTIYTHQMQLRLME